MLGWYELPSGPAKGGLGVQPVPVRGHDQLEQSRAKCLGRVNPGQVSPLRVNLGRVHASRARGAWIEGARWGH